MSRVGKLPIDLPKDVRVEISASDVKVVGPRGEMSLDIPNVLNVDVKDSQIVVSTKKSTKRSKSLHGTYRSLLSNMILGVRGGWTKTLELVGTGYRAKLEGDTLIITVGFSHPVEFKAPKGISFKVEKSLITVEGINKELVGQTAAMIRAIRPPEPYKGKGIRYQDEVVRRKPGKAAKAAGSPA
jgi:large subunit ribosomal protein L6